MIKNSQLRLAPLGEPIVDFDFDDLPTLDMQQLRNCPKLDPKLQRLLFDAPVARRGAHARAEAEEAPVSAAFVSSSAYRTLTANDDLQLIDREDFVELLKRDFDLYEYDHLVALFAPSWIRGCPQYKPEDERLQQWLLRPRLRTRKTREVNSARVYGPVWPEATEPSEEVGDSLHDLRTALSVIALEEFLFDFDHAKADPDVCASEQEPELLLELKTTRLADVSTLVPKSCPVVFGGDMRMSVRGVETVDGSLPRPNEESRLSKGLNVGILEKFDAPKRGRRSGLPDTDYVAGDFNCRGIKFDRELRHESSDDEPNTGKRRFKSYREEIDELKRTQKSLGFVLSTRHFGPPVEEEMLQACPPLRPLDIRKYLPSEASPRPGAPAPIEPLWKTNNSALQDLKKSFAKSFVPAAAPAPGPDAPPVASVPPRATDEDSLDSSFSFVYRIDPPFPASLVTALSGGSPEEAPAAVPDAAAVAPTVQARVHALLTAAPEHPLRLALEQVARQWKAAGALKAVASEQRRSELYSALFGP